ncbi:SRPBCC domain-containing protein [Actinophytocola algeriensis]|uniref:Uncharacterized protein YndB with AHSA1/START domain n=1 Tax=Actinophytocola algeriensis TaxID=1768010 RepID=A0A7W7Q9W5_9PSEU|nr:SRPBCC domain-containing protein [Actinophytocola algeriensis]MBB4909558.1 uncharacterized protein YndB with AHSA1/START domain [Actinophytocola algeriensis]MBE1475548.1 uncharacterized protein YndB with AHSA1/START domain [Actinophytocola algeriensis]
MSHVITSVKVEIAAPAAFVWDVLTDFANYPQWNPYTVAVATTLEIGTPIDLTLPNPDGSDGTFVNREWVRVVDPPHHLRYDTADEMPGIFAVRDQWLTELGPDRCAYHTTDAISGRYADQVMELTGAWVQAGFDSVADALKARAEALHHAHLS